MEARAKARHVRISARKARLVVDQIRGKSVNEAYALLQFSKKNASEPVGKTLRSAVANAQVKSQDEGSMVDVDDLFVREAYVDEGPTLRRWRARAQGRASPIRKRTSHITVVVDTKDA
jgi:large subunit ribosomal protein L22